MQGSPQYDSPPIGQPPAYGRSFQSPPQQVIIINQAPGVFQDSLFCRVCNKNTPSRIDYEAGVGTWLICVGAILLGFWLGCCLIPFCVDSLQDKLHYCTICQALKHRKNLI